MINQKIQLFQASSKWHVTPAIKLFELCRHPLSPEVVFPNSILTFYELCSNMEAVIKDDDDLDVILSSPSEFQWLPQRLFDERLEKYIDTLAGSMLLYWYVFGKCGTEEYFVVDLHPNRYEHCYYINRYDLGPKGSTSIIAYSFPDFLQKLYVASLAEGEWLWTDNNLGKLYETL